MAALQTPERSASSLVREAPGAPMRRNSLPPAFFAMQPLTDSESDRPFHAARNLANLFQTMSVEPARPPTRTNAVVMRKALLTSSAPGVASSYFEFNASDLDASYVPKSLIAYVQRVDAAYHRHAAGCGGTPTIELRTRVDKVATFSCAGKCDTITITTL